MTASDRSIADRLPEVRILGAAEAATAPLLDELRAAVQRRPRALLGFATGKTFAELLRALADAVVFGRLDGREFTATHLDEYLGFPPDRPGGMVHELVQHCPAFGEMLRAGTFLPVPHDGDPSRLAAHEAALQQLGGVELQLLGIGRNGHLAFNEPGTPFDSDCHVTELAATTRADARARFRPDEPPRRAATAGLATILRARRLVLCAFGANKAAAVQSMLEGPVDPACPASVLRRHAKALVLLDEAAASGLRRRDAIEAR